MENELWIIYSTFRNRQEALSVAQSLLEKRMIACANIQDGITSVYRWQGKMQQENEAIMVMKTTQAQLNQAMAEIKQLHSYELPCIVSYPAEKAYAPYADWVKAECKGDGALI